MPGITAGVDGSDNSIRALDWAMHEATIRHVELRVLAVHDAIANYWSGSPVTVLEDEQAVVRTRQAAEDATAKAAARLSSGQPPAVTVQTVHGFAAEELIKASADSELLVLGARGGGFARHILGSVSTKVVHHAGCPVVLVPASEERRP